ncbi:bactofilin family protein [Flexilinea flocculi]|jgi:hypothetical protein|uniref:Polymer-forming cytoskeletal n=1 Tax=Flexilinea flocculi TaxID=1678840 RepID=A0A0S7BL78_9CHLR|nr:polymer-forming cytoskeletal protein [Flexilinea flocculi]GAP41021.1 polymer-forming cytoskeletal [Flexilinea flocculi]
MEMNKRFHLFSIILCVFVLMTVLFIPVQAAEFDQDGLLESDEVIDDDLFIGGDTVDISGEINGNLLSSGNTVTLNGKVNGNAIIVGNTIHIAETAVIDGNLFVGCAVLIIDGQVTGSVFTGGASLSLDKTAEIGRNVFYGGYSLEAAEGSQIGKDLFAGIYQAMLKGSIERDVKAGAGAFELSGNVGRDVNVDLGIISNKNDQSMNFMKNMPFMQNPAIPDAIPVGLRISDEAEIGRNLTYSCSQDLSAGIQSTPGGKITFNEVTTAETVEKHGFLNRFLLWLVDTARKFITLLILGLLAVWLIPLLLKKTEEQVKTQPLPSAGYGALTIILGYLAAIVAAGIIFGVGILISLLTLGGLSKVIFGVGFSGLSLLVTIFTFLVSYGSKIVVAFMVGNWILSKIAPSAKGRNYWAIVIGVILYVILSSIPLVGWIFTLAAKIIGMGAMWLAYRARKKTLQIAEENPQTV